MTDNEIIKALECCSIDKMICKKCPLYCNAAACVHKLTAYALNLINRQQAEIEKLKEIAESPILGKLVYVWKNEAIREFAGKLKLIAESTRDYSQWLFTISEEQLDNLVKEMVGEDNDKL